MDGGRTTERQYSEYSDFFSTQREPEYDQDTDLHLRGPLKSDGVDETGDANQILVWVTHRTTGRGGRTMIGSIRTHSLSRQNSRRAANVEREVGQPSIGYLKRRLHTETISGISHQMDQIARRLVVTFRRATMIGLQRKNILIYLHPDDHMLDMWQKDYVLQLDNWRK